MIKDLNSKSQEQLLELQYRALCDIEWSDGERYLPQETAKLALLNGTLLRRLWEKVEDLEDVEVEEDKQAEPVAFINEKCAIQATLHGAITLKPGDNLYTHPAQPVQAAGAQGEPVAWRPILQHPIPWVTGKPQESDIRHWTSQGCEIEYAYTHPAPAVAVNEHLLKTLKSWYEQEYGHGAGPTQSEIEAAIAAAEAEKARGRG